MDPVSLSDLVLWNTTTPPILPVVFSLSAAGYLGCFIRLRRRGVEWRVQRLLVFLLGCLAGVLVTGLNLDRYGQAMMSAFMFQHLTLSMLIPPLLVLGAPGVLLATTASLHPRTRRTARWWVRGGGRRICGAVLHPIVSIPLFLYSYYGIYLTGVLNAALARPYGHFLLEVFFLVSGLIFVIPILSVAKLPAERSNWGRLFDLFVEMPLHAFFGVILMVSSYPAVAIFAERSAELGSDPLSDQKLAGALAWAYGEPVAVLIVVIVAMRWRRSENLVEADAGDRQMEDELTEYNTYLQELTRRSERYRT